MLLRCRSTGERPLAFERTSVPSSGSRGCKGPDLGLCLEELTGVHVALME